MSEALKGSRLLAEQARKMGRKPVSYSQLSMYSTCPYQWKLQYIDKVDIQSASIHLLFGSALHRVLQEYITTIYTVSVIEADKMDFETLLIQYMKEEFLDQAKRFGNSSFATREDMISFCKDGMEILEFIRKRRIDYFDKKEYELIGIEGPLNIPTDSNDKIAFIGFLDVVLREKISKRIKIIDIKTSTTGWNDGQKKDQSKLNQLLLYKKYYAKEYFLEPEDIDIEFFIVKRKIFSHGDFPAKRVQLFRPASGKISLSKAEKCFSEFIDIFKLDGTLKENIQFEKIASPKSCKWCKFKDHPEYCDRNKN